MKKIVLSFTVLTALAVALIGASQAGSMEHKAHKGKDAAAMIEVAPDQVKWGAAPAGLPEGAQGAVLEGDPSKPGYFAVRLKAPAGYKIAPHTHPGIERVTVLQGTVALGMGRTWDESTLKTYGPGSYVSIPKGHEHFAMVKEGAILQLASIGPWGINYINPQDDPRKATKGR